MQLTGSIHIRKTFEGNSDFKAVLMGCQISFLGLIVIFVSETQEEAFKL
jgi:hypothetical protein